MGQPRIGRDERGAPIDNPAFPVASIGFNALVAFNARELVSVVDAPGLAEPAAELTELIHVGQMAMLTGSTMRTFRENIFNFPTLAEAYRVAAIDLEAQRQARSSAVVDEAA